jgi:hypothetical protein
MTSRPEPHRDQRTIRSFKRTCNAALLLWVARRAEQPAPQAPLRPARLLAAAAAGGVLVALGVDSTSLHGLP